MLWSYVCTRLQADPHQHRVPRGEVIVTTSSSLTDWLPMKILCAGVAIIELWSGGERYTVTPTRGPTVLLGRAEGAASASASASPGLAAARFKPGRAMLRILPRTPRTHQGAFQNTSTEAWQRTPKDELRP